MFNLTFVWGGLIAFIIAMYVILDGFDLGIGILFPFVKSGKRDMLMNTITPVWDGNETWMVLGGATLYGAFPIVYSTVLPTLYIPLLLMVAALIFRGVSLEFRFKVDANKKILWDSAFAVGSIVAAFCQGLILGTFVEGKAYVDTQAYSWFSPFTVFTGFAVIIGYALLGAGWLIAKTEHDLQKKMYKAAMVLLILLSLCLAVVSGWTPFISEFVMHRWFSWPNMLYLAPLPLLTLFCILLAFYSLKQRKEWWPFILSIAIFMLAYAGFIVSIWPYMVPYHITLWEAAAPRSTQIFLLVGVLILMPILLAYTAYAYHIFRGKVRQEEHHY
ncbi:MAG: cytochrome ubiquinol oxidase subunit cyanide insensitive [Gammaproteobacteria bacterium]|jgi:cytochrome d ubiquinol oxidase subunit II|nr:cytochrome ubiquinol oxidase subunit cyanide insensitive [Gammaproteobacteria bacterium]